MNTLDDTLHKCIKCNKNCNKRKNVKLKMKLAAEAHWLEFVETEPKLNVYIYCTALWAKLEKLRGRSQGCS